MFHERLFEKIMIRRLKDTLNNLYKLNHGKYGKYQLCSSKIDMAYDDTLSFEEKWIKNGPRCYQTLSATSTRKTTVSTTSTSYIYQKETSWMFIYYFSNLNRFKMVTEWSRVIKVLSNTFSDLNKLNHVESSSASYGYQKLTWRMFIYLLFFKD